MANKEFLRILSPYVDFVDEIFNKYEWSSNDRFMLKKSLNELHRKNDDNCVNIAVIGEFSSGKSSVINAMLGVELLVMDDLPDTTLVPSVISYSDKPILKISYANGDSKVIDSWSLAEIRDYIAQYSFRDELLDDYEGDDDYNRMMELRDLVAKKAGNINKFEIGLPSIFLKSGFCIIDTPGLNSLNEHCTKVTNEVLKDCDASIIVGTATGGGLHQDFRENLVKVLGHRLNNSVVVFTHYDQLQRNNREKTMTYLHATTASYFDIKPDLLPVLPMVPPTILRAINGKKFGKEHDEMFPMTCRSLEKIIDYSVKMRETIILTGLSKILSDLLSKLYDKTLNLRKEYEKRLEVLKRSQSLSFYDIKLKHTSGLSGSFNHPCSIYRATLSGKLDRIIRLTNANITYGIKKNKDVEGVKKFLDTGLADELESSTKGMNTLLSEAKSYIDSLVQNQYDEFVKDLREEYSRLNIVNIPIENLKLNFISHEIKLLDSMKFAIEYADKEAKREDLTYGLAGLGGIIGIGCAIFTAGLSIPIGMGIGGVLGGLIGSRGKSLDIDDVYNRLKAKYDKPLNDALTGQKNKVLSAFDTIVENSRNNFYEQITKFGDRYKSQIDSLLNEEKKKKFDVDWKIYQINQDINKIENNSKKLEEIWKNN